MIDSSRLKWKTISYFCNIFFTNLCSDGSGMYSIERFSGCWNHQKLGGKFKFLVKNEENLCNHIVLFFRHKNQVLQLEFFEKPLEEEGWDMRSYFWNTLMYSSHAQLSRYSPNEFFTEFSDHQLMCFRGLGILFRKKIGLAQLLSNNVRITSEFYKIL